MHCGKHSRYPTSSPPNRAHHPNNESPLEVPWGWYIHSSRAKSKWIVCNSERRLGVESLFRQQFDVANPPLSCAEDNCYCNSPGGRKSQFDPEVFSSQCWSKAHLPQREEHQQDCVTWHPNRLLYSYIGFPRTSNRQEVSTFAARFRTMVKWIVVDELHLVSDHVVL